MIIDDLIQNQLFQGIVITIITVFLIPWYTRTWADRQQELAIKNNLVDQISQSVTNIFESMSFRFHQDGKQREASFQTWRTNTALIGAELRTYFPESWITYFWNRIYYPTTDIFLLFEQIDKKRSVDQFNRLKNNFDIIKEYFPKLGLENANWELIRKTFVDNTEKIDYTNSELWDIWKKLYNDLNDLKYEVIKKIVRGHIDVFSHGITFPRKNEPAPREETET